MTRPEALASLRALARGLPVDLAGEARLLELVAGHDAGEAPRSMLVELGARSLLDTVANEGAFHRADPSCRRSFTKPGNSGAGRA